MLSRYIGYTWKVRAIARNTRAKINPHERLPRQSSRHLASRKRNGLRDGVDGSTTPPAPPVVVRTRTTVIPQSAK